MKKLLLLIVFIPTILLGQKTEDESKALNLHNQARIAVGVAPLEWSNNLEKQALNYARYLARKNKFKHSKTNHGENLYKAWGRIGKNHKHFDNPLYDASAAWYAEKKHYRYSKIRKFRFSTKMIGHYTQMVWSKTKHVGIASAKSKDGTVYVVARYSPAGNYIGEHPY